MKSYLKNVRSFDLLALLGGPALLGAFIWNISSPPAYKHPLTRLVVRAKKKNISKKYFLQLTVM